MTIEKLSAWVPVTDEMLADALPFGAVVEYRMLGASERPLSLRERLTGWRHYTARNGYTATFRVGWRSDLYWLTHPIENWRRHHPPAYDDEDDW